MRELLHQYFNIAFLMGKPQDLPAGREQLKIGVLLALITYVMALAVPYGLIAALLQAVIDLGCTALVLHVGLSMMDKRARFEQAFGGLCGASAFINLAAMPLYSLRPQGQIAQASSPSISVLADFVLLVWGLSLLAHVVRHTFEVSMVVSVIVSFVYFLVLSTLIGSLISVPTVEPAALSHLDSGTWYAIAQAQYSR